MHRETKGTCAGSQRSSCRIFRKSFRCRRMGRTPLYMLALHSHTRTVCNAAAGLLLYSLRLLLRVSLSLPPSLSLSLVFRIIGLWLRV